MTCSIELWFTAHDVIELQSTVFRNGSELRRTMRGRARTDDFGAFPWTTAVKSLTVLLLEAALMSRYFGGSGGQAEIVGGPAVVSLDYSLGKIPQWLRDMFGSEREVPICRTLFERTNPEGKGKGPVGVRLNNAQIQPENICIIVDESRVYDRQTIIEICTQLRSELAIGISEPEIRKARESQLIDGSRSTSLSFNPLTSISSSFYKQLRTLLLAEIHSMLSGTEIFSLTQYRQSIRSILSDLSFQRLAGNRVGLMDQLDTGISARARLGIDSELALKQKVLEQIGPIRIACPPTLVGAIAVLSYLKKVSGCQIELDCSAAHTLQILKSLQSNTYRPDLSGCVLTAASGASLLASGRADFEPLMLMPRISHRIVAPASSDLDINRGHYAFMTDLPATASFYFDDLVERGLIDRANVSVRHVEADQTSELLKTGDPLLRAIQVFPNYAFSSILNGCIILDQMAPTYSNRETLLFIRRGVLKGSRERELFESAMRDAWLTLRDDSAALESVVDSLMTDRYYLSSLARSCGLEFGNHGVERSVLATQL